MSPRETLHSIRFLAESDQPNALSTIRDLAMTAAPPVIVLDDNSRRDLRFLLERLYHTALSSGARLYCEREVLAWLEKLSD